jgi:hypothetical protein
MPTKADQASRTLLGDGISMIRGVLPLCSDFHRIWQSAARLRLRQIAIALATNCQPATTTARTRQALAVPPPPFKSRVSR